MAQYLSTCMPWEIVVCVEYKDLNGILQQRQPATKRDIVYQFRFEGPLQTFMHCAPRTQIPRISCYEITDTCERVFQRFGIRSKGSGYPLQKNCHPFNGTGYPFEKGISSLGTTIHSRKIVIRSRSNGSGCPLEKCHLSSNGSSYPFKTIVIRATVPNHFQPSC